eukprot:XP_001699584.1 ERD4-related membrane protein [Chlamydomonas reinhardtii]
MRAPESAITLLPYDQGSTTAHKHSPEWDGCNPGQQIPQGGSGQEVAVLSIGDAQYQVSDNQVLDSLYINMVWGGLCMMGFMILRGWLKGPGAVFQRRQLQLYPRLCSSMYWLGLIRCVHCASSAGNFDARRAGFHQLPPLRRPPARTSHCNSKPQELQDLFMRPPLMFVGTIKQIWNWFSPLLSVSDADIIRSAGYDALVLTRVLQIGLQMFTFMAIFGVGVMIPIYYTGAGLATSTAALGDLSRISLANLIPGSLVYLVPFFFCYLFSAYGCFVLWINCKGYVQLRMSYFLCLDALPHEDVLAAGHSWLNLFNFFNPSLRLMLDHLDWMNPLQLTSALFGVRNMRLPSLYRDEPPYTTRMYGRSQKLRQWDDQVADSLWGGVPLRGVPGPQQSLDLEDLDVEGGQQHKEEKNPDPGHAGSKPDLDNLVNSSEGEEERDEGADGGSVWASRDLPAVLPYWRPLKVQLKLGARAGKAAAASNPSGSLTMIESAWDLISRPLQPLLAGKRNTRLRQIVQHGPSWIERMGAVTYIMVATTRARIHKLFGVATHQIGIGVAARADVSGAGGPDGPTDDQLVHRRWDRWVGADILRNVRRYYALFYNTVKPYEQVDLDDEDLVDPDGVVPVIDHDSVEKLIAAWDRAMWALTAALRELRLAEAANAHLDEEAAGAAADKMEGGGGDGGGSAAAGSNGQKHGLNGGAGKGGQHGKHKVKGGCGGCRKVKRVPEDEMNLLRESVMKAKVTVKALEGQIEEERARVLRVPLGTAYFAFFNCSQGPAMLLSFTAEPAPAPDDVAWPNLWSTRPWQQIPRQLGALLLLSIIFLIPIGAVQGIISNLDVALCAGNPSGTTEGGATPTSSTNQLYLDWFCNPGTFAGRIAKSLVTGVLPSVLGMVWTSVVMPHLLFMCSSLSRRRKSLSAQDREMQAWFFWYSLFNTFLGAVLGGGVFSQIGVYLKDPSSLLEHIGKALPSTANFFIQYVIARAVFNNTLRFIWPHAGQMLAAIIRTLLRADIPKNMVRAAFAHMVPSARAATFYNVILQIFMFSSAFAVAAPIILPCAWFFFLTGFFAYRYSLLYIYERSYDNEAWTPGIVLVCTLTPALVVFWRFCDRAYLKPLHHPPLTLVAREPLGVRVDPLVYMPPALRPGALGWYPEQGKVWEKYGIPKHW